MKAEQEPAQKPPMKFIIVQVKDVDEEKNISTLLLMVPINWVSYDKKCYLYPPESQYVGGFAPANWAAKVFLRFRHPLESWLEFDVERTVLDKPSKRFLMVP